MRFREMLYRFFQGRYGFDTLSYTLFAVYFVLCIINTFLGSLILQLLCTALIFYIFFRTLSRNTYKRAAENQAFLKVFGGKIKAVKRRGEELKDSQHIYKKCPHCHSRLRLKRRRGSHTVKCPRCNAQFKIFSLFS